MTSDLRQYYNVIYQVISYWPSYGSAVCCIGRRPKAMDQYSRSRTVAGPILNKLINDNLLIN